MYGTLERSANVHVENSVYKVQFLNSFKQKMNDNINFSQSKNVFHKDFKNMYSIHCLSHCFALVGKYSS